MYFVCLVQQCTLNQLLLLRSAWFQELLILKLELVSLVKEQMNFGIQVNYNTDNNNNNNKNNGYVNYNDNYQPHCLVEVGCSRYLGPSTFGSRPQYRIMPPWLTQHLNLAMLTTRNEIKADQPCQWREDLVRTPGGGDKPWLQWWGRERPNHIPYKQRNPVGNGQFW